MIPTSGAAGWACPACGAWVSYGTAHTCNPSPVQPWPSTFPQPGPLQWKPNDYHPTQREYFAIRIMPHLLGGQGFQQAARDARAAADALIDELATAKPGAES